MPLRRTCIHDLTSLTGDPTGEHLGYIAEEPRGFLGTISRQAFATHRPFRAVIMDKEGTPVLWEGFSRMSDDVSETRLIDGSL